VNFINKWKCVYLQKIREERDNTNVVYYRVWYSPLAHGLKAYNLFFQELHNKEGIITMSIDLSSHYPKLVEMCRIYREPLSHQTTAANNIIGRYNKSKNKNTKFIIYGSRGVGKTYTSVIVKRKLDEKGLNVKLFEDFDPSAVGLNVNKLILSGTSNERPIIIIINEIDVMFEKVLNDPPSYDSRIQHTKDKSTFNNMMDSIANTPNVILIGTTEKSYEDLTLEKYQSFIRKGRIDYFMHMTKKNIKTSINIIGN